MWESTHVCSCHTVSGSQRITCGGCKDVPGPKSATGLSTCQTGNGFLTGEHQQFFVYYFGYQSVRYIFCRCFSPALGSCFFFLIIMKQKCRRPKGTPPLSLSPISGHVSSLHQDYLTHAAFCRKWDSSKVAKALAQSCYSSLGRGHEYSGLLPAGTARHCQGQSLPWMTQRGQGQGACGNLPFKFFPPYFWHTWVVCVKRPSVQAIEHWLQEELS